MAMRPILAFVGALAALTPSAFAAEIAIPSNTLGARTNSTSLPSLNIERECRQDVAAADLGAQSAAYEGCVHQERAAYQLLRQQWDHVAVQERATCMFPGGDTSYVALLTCLQLQPGGKLAVKGAGSDKMNSQSMSIMPSQTPSLTPPPAATSSPQP